MNHELGIMNKCVCHEVSSIKTKVSLVAAESLGRKSSGFSTLEMLIAMTILILCLSAVVLVSSGNQSMLIDSQTNAEALNIAQKLLEQEQALARKDFKLVNATSTAQDIYTGTVEVSPVVDPITNATDYFSKLVTATVSWPAENNRQLKTQLWARVTNFNNLVGGDTCNSMLTGDWRNPVASNFNFYQLADETDTIYPVSGIDAYVDASGKGRLYVSVSKTDQKTDPTFFIFDINNPNESNPVLLGKTDNNSNVASAGLAQIAVATNIFGSYAYAAVNYGANFNTVAAPCDNNGGTNASCGQLQVIDVSNSASPQVKYTYEINVPPGNPGGLNQVVGSGGNAIGNSIFYKDGYVDLGLTKTDSGSDGPEFNIIDVHNPLAPVWRGGYVVGHAVNAIYVKDGFAYVAHPTASGDAISEQVTVLDVSNPYKPVRVSGFHMPDNAGHGNTLYTVGDTLYFGSTLDSGSHEFYILNNSDPTKLQENNAAAASAEIGSSINGLIVRDYLGFLITTNSQFQVWDLTNKSAPAQINSATQSFFGSGAAFDCEGNYFYAGSADGSDNGYLTIIAAH